MEAITVAESTNGDAPEATFDGEAEATRSTVELFQWSKYVHVGAGAAECEHAEDGECKDSQHFHAWVCLPNVFQIRDIGEKARAAKARKKRALLDPESDSYAIMEDELADYARDDMTGMIERIAQANISKRIGEIVRELQEDERFENQEQDAEELRRLTALPEDERGDKEEYDRLQAQVLAYGESFEKLVGEQQEREQESLRKQPAEQVIELERRRRIEETSAEMFWHTYYTWAMYVGARQPVKSGFAIRRKFPQAEDLRSAPPEVVTALREAIAELENATAVRSDAAGN